MSRGFRQLYPVSEFASDRRRAIAKYIGMSEEAYFRRRDRLRALFQGRCRQLDEAQSTGDDYGGAVIRYTRAREAWRAIRGWLP